MKKIGIVFGSLVILAASFSHLSAGESTSVPKEIACDSAKCDKSDKIKDWALEVGTGVQFSNVRASNLDAYTIVPIRATLALKIDDVSLDTFAGGFLRGYTEFLFQGYADVITHGPENEIYGFNVGPRYNFVQPGWKVVPYVEGLVGLGFADSQPYSDASGFHGLGQDFNFTFGVGGGFRYDIDESWFVRLGCDYTHFSNAGLSEPAHPNRAIDALGPQISVGSRF